MRNRLQLIWSVLMIFGGMNVVYSGKASHRGVLFGGEDVKSLGWVFLVFGCGLLIDYFRSSKNHDSRK